MHSASGEPEGARSGPARGRGWRVSWCGLPSTRRSDPLRPAMRCACLRPGSWRWGWWAGPGAPRGGGGGRLAAVAAGTSAAAWLIPERLLHAGRPPGPFGNPNLAATPALLALALAPRLRAPVAVRGVLM